MPEFELGYRFAGGTGELRAHFQFLGSTGTGTVANFDPAGAALLTSQLNVDVLDLQYANTEVMPVRLPWISPIANDPRHVGLRHSSGEQPKYPPIVFTYCDRRCELAPRFTTRRPWEPCCRSDR